MPENSNSIFYFILREKLRDNIEKKILSSEFLTKNIGQTDKIVFYNVIVADND